jgi:hypothetical protein
MRKDDLPFGITTGQEYSVGLVLVHLKCVLHDL